MIRVLDWNTLPRPERSGMLGVLLALALLQNAVAPFGGDPCFLERCTEAAAASNSDGLMPRTWITPAQFYKSAELWMVAPSPPIRIYFAHSNSRVVSLIEGEGVMRQHCEGEGAGE